MQKTPLYIIEDLTLVWMVELENGHSVLVKKQFMKMLCMGSSYYEGLK